ncbi:ADP-ribosylglycohydrolase family protein [Adlercreutzia sp. ZJ242]|uniref:ADP-ribosylglycohydrolase family protein n=1 Tax=Adlercreutzia sp. ZJ242 TaxID=2709409 RepID=UPI0013EBA305|nr:ADP-ribosylglycohydrolase family protein [Adlercreutzia sp. ZJ242]
MQDLKKMLQEAILAAKNGVFGSAVIERSEKKATPRAFGEAFGDFHEAKEDAEMAEVVCEREKRERYLSKFQGCLVGGAAGDALGFAVEFMSRESMIAKYGSGGIRCYAYPKGRPPAPISDDTQMTLFTAAGILEGSTRGSLRGVAGPACNYAHRAYLDWLKTQEPEFDGNPGSTWLLAVPELHVLRAPGRTCLSTLRSGRVGTMEEPVNDSKGCGGVMRVAPWGLFVRGDFGDDAVREGAAIAAVTHGHPLGWIPAGVLCYIVNRCCFGVSEGCDHPALELRRIVGECVERLPAWFPEQKEYAGEMADLLRQALLCAADGASDSESIARLGQGWVGEEALAIAVYAAVRHADDFSGAIIAAANHDGDSDSTAAICGNIVGALLGYGAIDEEWTRDLELHGLIMEVAKDLCDDCPMDEYGHYRDEEWLAKYGGSVRGRWP